MSRYNSINFINTPVLVDDHFLFNFVQLVLVVGLEKLNVLLQAVQFIQELFLLRLEFLERGQFGHLIIKILNL